MTSATSSIHRSPIEFLSIVVFSFVLFLSISLLISSISVEYWVTAKTPPCLMLLFFILIGLVFPKAVLIVAVRFWFSLSVSFQAAPLHPCLSMTYIMPLSHALSYAFVTSRKVTYVSFFISLFCLMASLILSMWSERHISFLPPAWFWLIFISFTILLLSSLSYVFPMLLDRVIPLSLLHLPFIPFPL